MSNKTGSCLCGAVKFEITGPLRPVIACHCLQCRKQTGTYMSATATKDEYFRLTEQRGLKWYRSSPEARRGFCGECGSVLFWKGDGRDYTAIAAGSIDGSTRRAARRPHLLRKCRRLLRDCRRRVSGAAMGAQSEGARLIRARRGPS